MPIPGSTENKDISFHRLPTLPTTKRDEIKKKWVQNIKRKVVSSTLYICSERDLKIGLTGTKPRNILKEEAVHTRFSHMSDSTRPEENIFITTSRRKIIQEGNGRRCDFKL